MTQVEAYDSSEPMYGQVGGRRRKPRKTRKSRKSRRKSRKSRRR